MRPPPYWILIPGRKAPWNLTPRWWPTRRRHPPRQTKHTAALRDGTAHRTSFPPSDKPSSNIFGSVYKERGGGRVFPPGFRGHTMPPTIIRCFFSPGVPLHVRTAGAAPSSASYSKNRHRPPTGFICKGELSSAFGGMEKTSPCSRVQVRPRASACLLIARRTSSHRPARHLRDVVRGWSALRWCFQRKSKTACPDAGSNAQISRI